MKIAIIDLMTSTAPVKYFHFLPSIVYVNSEKGSYIGLALFYFLLYISWNGKEQPHE